jgi:signal transduction histidine kinase
LNGQALLVDSAFSSKAVAPFMFQFSVESFDTSFLKMNNAPPELWRRTHSRGFKKPYNSDAWWLKFDIKCSKTGRYFLENEYTMLETYQLFLETPKGVLVYGNAGILKPSTKGVHRYRNPTFDIFLEAGNTYTVYLLVRKTFSTNIQPIYLHEKSFFLTKIEKEEWIQGLIYGVMLILVLQAFISFILFREINYLYFIGYSFSLLFILTIGNGFYRLIFPSHLQNFIYFTLYFWILNSILFLYLLIKNMIQVNIKHFSIRIFKVLLPVSFISYFVTLFLYLYQINLPSVLFKTLISFFLIFPLLLIYFLLNTYRTFKNKSAFYFLTIFSFTLFFYISFTLLPYLNLNQHNYLYFKWIIVFESIAVLMVVVNDLYKSKLTLIQLQSEEIERKEQLANSYIKGLTDERRRLSDELHNSISARLSVLKMKLSQFSLSFDVYEFLNVHINQIQHEVRKTSHDLSSAVLSDKGLIAAIEDEIFIWEDAKPDIQFTFKNNLEDISLSSEINQLLYWSFLELLHNCVKHSQTEVIHIKLWYTTESILLEIEDEGIGLIPNVNSDGIGLKNIQYRASLHMGKFDIIQKDKGLIQRLLLPIHA